MATTGADWPGARLTRPVQVMPPPNVTVLAADVFITTHSKPSPQSPNCATDTVPPFGRVTMARL